MIHNEEIGTQWHVEGKRDRRIQQKTDPNNVCNWLAEEGLRGITKMQNLLKATIGRKLRRVLFDNVLMRNASGFIMSSFPEQLVNIYFEIAISSHITLPIITRRAFRRRSSLKSQGAKFGLQRGWVMVYFPKRPFMRVSHCFVVANVIVREDTSSHSDFSVLTELLPLWMSILAWAMNYPP